VAFTSAAPNDNVQNYEATQPRETRFFITAVKSLVRNYNIVNTVHGVKL